MPPPLALFVMIILKMNFTMKNILKLTLLALAFVFVQCADDFEQPAPATGQTIVDIASGSNDFNILTAAVVRVGLAASLDNNNSGVFTVFAPTDAAFVTYFNTLTDAQLPPGAPAAGTLDEAAVLDVINNRLAATYNPPKTTAITPATLFPIINYHITSTAITSADVKNGEGRTTMQGARLSISKQGAAVVLNANRAGSGAGNGATVVTADVLASNGVVHAIDKVLIPVSQTNIWTGTGFPNFGVNYGVNPPVVSVFGTNMARNSDGSINVSTAPTGAAEYHLISMAIARANLATVIIPNSAPLPDFTLFAPTDLSLATHLVGSNDEVAARNMLNSMTPQAVADVVNYHLVKGRFVSTDFVDGQNVSTLLTGKTFKIRSVGPPLTINDLNLQSPPNEDPAADATVLTPNVLTNAGVLHGINAVLKSN